MNQKMKRRDAVKAIAAFGGLFAFGGISEAQIIAGPRTRLGTGWLYQGQPCIIIQQGAMLLLINEIGSVGSGVWTGSNTFTVLSGTGWDAGLTAQISNRGRTINWSNATVWTSGSAPRRPQNLEGGWLYSGQPCAVFQQENFLILINEVGSIGSCILTGTNSLTAVGGGGWDLGLTAQIADNGNTLYWSNNTVWTRA
jgi:hypothetical protein